MEKRVLLLIEDNPLLTGMYKAAFEEKGFEVILAHDGEEGLRLIKENKPGLVLLDLMMPGMDGFGVLEKLRGDSDTKDTKVVVLTVLKDKESQEKAKKFGILDYLIKTDLELGEIVERVSKHFT